MSAPFAAASPRPLRRRLRRSPALATLLGLALLHGLPLSRVLADDESHPLERYSEYLVGTPATETRPPRGREVSITYLGVNGYLIRSANTTIVADPYFTRFPARYTVLNLRVETCPQALAYGLASGAFPRRVDGFLVTHCHFDHLFDVPALQRRLGGKIVTCRTGMHLCEASGSSRRDILISLPGSVHRIGEATVHVLPAKHDKVLGDIPYQGQITKPLRRAPKRPADWVLGTPLSFLIELHGKRIYLEAGAGQQFIPEVNGLDLAILGVALKDSRTRFPAAARSLGARYLLPSHQDTFFTPAEKGFKFTPLSDFPAVKAAHDEGDLPGDLILMDYFHTWTIPD